MLRFNFLVLNSKQHLTSRALNVEPGGKCLPHKSVRMQWAWSVDFWWEPRASYSSLTANIEAVIYSDFHASLGISLPFLNSRNESTAYPVLEAPDTLSFQSTGTSKALENSTFLHDAQAGRQATRSVGSSGDHLAYLQMTQFIRQSCVLFLIDV